MRCIGIGEDRPKTYQGCKDCSKECRGGLGEKCGSTSTASTPLLIGVGGWRVDVDFTRIDHIRGAFHMASEDMTGSGTGTDPGGERGGA